MSNIIMNGHFDGNLIGVSCLLLVLFPFGVDYNRALMWLSVLEYDCPKLDNLLIVSFLLLQNCIKSLSA